MKFFIRSIFFLFLAKLGFNQVESHEFRDSMIAHHDYIELSPPILQSNTVMDWCPTLLKSNQANGNYTFRTFEGDDPNAVIVCYRSKDGMVKQIKVDMTKATYDQVISKIQQEVEGDLKPVSLPSYTIPIDDCSFPADPPLEISDVVEVLNSPLLSQQDSCPTQVHVDPPQPNALFQQMLTAIPQSEFNITWKKTMNGSVSISDNPYHLKLISIPNSPFSFLLFSNCMRVSFTFQYRGIYLNELTSTKGCEKDGLLPSEKRGQELLSMLESLGRCLGMESIALDDASAMKCDKVPPKEHVEKEEIRPDAWEGETSLSMLSFLKEGRTFYEKAGYTRASEIIAVPESLLRESKASDLFKELRNLIQSQADHSSEELTADKLKKIDKLESILEHMSDDQQKNKEITIKDFVAELWKQDCLSFLENFQYFLLNPPEPPESARYQRTFNWFREVSDSFFISSPGRHWIDLKKPRQLSKKISQ